MSTRKRLVLLGCFLFLAAGITSIALDWRVTDVLVYHREMVFHDSGERRYLYKRNRWRGTPAVLVTYHEKGHSFTGSDATAEFMVLSLRDGQVEVFTFPGSSGVPDAIMPLPDGIGPDWRRLHTLDTSEVLRARGWLAATEVNTIYDYPRD